MSKINLIPEIKQEQIKIRKLNILSTSIAVVAGSIVFVVIIILLSFIAVQKAQINGVEKETNKVNDQLKAYKNLEETVITLERGLNEAKSVLNGGPRWTIFFAELEKATPGDIQINNFSIQDNAISLSLTGKNVESIDRFIKSFSNYKLEEKNLFSNIVVNGFTKPDANKVNFQATLNLEKGILWN